MRIKLMKGDNIKSLKKIPDNYVDSIVTDPPYGLNFMGKKWDYEVPSIEFWKECLRVLKPGGHVLSFGGTRTYHRMVINIEDAGFEIRDQVQWLYGSGFPKSHNIGKVFDKRGGNQRELLGIERTKGESKFEGWGTALKPANEPICLARKPLSEKTIVDNCIKWGTGGMNIDGCRVGSEGGTKKSNIQKVGIVKTNFTIGEQNIKNKVENINDGRFPANIILDEEVGMILDEQIGILKGDSPNRGPRIGGGKPNFIDQEEKRLGIIQKENNTINNKKFIDKGGPSRFFYCAKVSKKERNLGLEEFKEKVIDGRDPKQDEKNVPFKKRTTPTKNIHPTIKPIKLMRYLQRLITPVGGITLDPFMGSGSSGISAQLEGFDFIGMELEEDYFDIAEARIKKWKEYEY